MANETKIIDEKAKQLQQELNKLPVVVKDIGLQFFKSRFRAQGWLDKGFEKWPARSPKAKRNKGRALLMDTGTLRNSISGRVEGDNIIFGTDVEYAKVHNEGGTIHHPGGERIIAHKAFQSGKRKGRVLFARNDAKATFAQKVNVGSYDIKMPKRQFMGDSQHLRNVLTKKIETTIKNVFK